MWFLNIVLKARQLGMTTFWCILFLDQILTRDNHSAVVIAHTQKDAEAIFDDKIKFAWDNLDQSIKEFFNVDAKNTKQLKFSNGSSIRVTTSARSGTVQYLLVTELGIMAFKYPEKAKEVKSGSLNAIHAGQIVVIEATAKGQEGMFYDMCKKAMLQIKGNEELTPMDYRFFFFPWWDDPKYSLKGNFVIPIDFQNYFKELEIKESTTLTREQKNWYVKKKAEQGDEMFSEFPSNVDEAFRANVEGSYYGKQFDLMMSQGRVTKVPWEPSVPVDTWWDLGIGDQNHIMFVQLVGAEIRFIDEYNMEGEGLSHYAKVLREKPYVYGQHIAPHDIAVHEYTSGEKRIDTAAKLGINFIIAEKLPVDEGIEAVRNIMPRIRLDEEHCPKTMAAFIGYRKQWNDKRGTFMNKPFHSAHSNPMDAVRMGAVTLPAVFRDNTKGSNERVGLLQPDVQVDPIIG